MSERITKDPVVYSRFKRPEVVPWPIGDGTAPIFEELIENGVRVLRETGRDDLNAYVQASLEETKVYNIINRFQRGDESVLSKSLGQFVDVTGMPTNLLDAYSVLLNIESKFNAMPPDVKKLFNGDFSIFVDAVANDKIGDLINVNSDVVKDGDNNAE